MDTFTGSPVVVTDLVHERTINMASLQDRIEALNPEIASALYENRKRSRIAAEKGVPANFSAGDFVLVAREHFNEGEKLYLRWRGPRRVVSAINDWVYLVEDLRNGELSEVHATRLKFYRDSSLHETAILSHVLSSETGMQVQRLLRLIETTDGIKVAVRWQGLTRDDDTEEPLHNVYEDVPTLLKKLLTRKSTPLALAAKARRELGLLRRGV